MPKENIFLKQFDMWIKLSLKKIGIKKSAMSKKYDIDTFVMGNDWEGKFDFLKPYCKVKYLERTPGISTTQIKEDLK